MIKNIKLKLLFAFALGFASSMEKPQATELHFRLMSGEEACESIQLPEALLANFDEIPGSKQILGDLKRDLLNLSTMRNDPRYNSDGSTKLIKGAGGVDVVFIHPEHYTSFRVEQTMPGAIRVVMQTWKGLTLGIFFDGTKESTLEYLDSIAEGDFDSIWDLKSKGLNPVLQFNSGVGGADSRCTFIAPTTIQVLEEVFENCIRVPIVDPSESGWCLANILETVKPAVIPYYQYFDFERDGRHVTIRVDTKQADYFFRLKVIGFNLRCFDRLPYSSHLLPCELNGKCFRINGFDIVGPGGATYCFPVNAETAAKLSEVDEKIDFTKESLYEILDGLGVPLENLLF